MKAIITYLFCLLMVTVLLLKAIAPVALASISEQEKIVLFEENTGEKEKSSHNAAQEELFDDVLMKTPGFVAYPSCSGQFTTVTDSHLLYFLNDVQTPPPDVC